MAIKVKITGFKDFYKKELASIQKLADNQIDAIAKETEVVLKQNVKASIQRPGSTGNLEEQMYREKIPNGWGIGNIPNLNSKAPQWKWLDSGVAGTGRRVPPSTFGSFTPGSKAPNTSSFREGRFNPDGKYPMVPTKPIQPHNFISKTILQIPSIVNTILNRVKK